jgi:CheY-like chemotaxis protein
VPNVVKGLDLGADDYLTKPFSFAVLSGDQFVEVFKQDAGDHYTSLGKVPTSSRAKTALFVPELNRYFLAVPITATTGRS